ncbi:MAG TPA: glycosyltransferase family 4 protein, partial [Polyangiaceae bacterium]
ERVALTVHEGLAPHGIESSFIVLDRPQRETYPEPEGAVRLFDRAKGRAERMAALANHAEDEGLDLLHAHLLDGAELRTLARRGLPLVTTLHNARNGWPRGLAEVGKTDLRAVFACSRTVGDDAREASLAGPHRVLWNGIAKDDLVHTRDAAAARALRASLELPPAARILVTVANARPQKRLELAVRTLAALRERGDDAYLVLVGATLPANEETERLVRAEVRSLGVEAFVRFVGSQRDVGPFLAMADVALSTSAWEGLSLAHLEALAAGVPLVTTAVGGSDELREKHGGVHVVPVDATPAEVALALREAALGPRPVLAPDFQAHTMVSRHAHLYRRAASPVRPGPVWLVANNFATGGAQRSAQRLLLALHERGVTVRAAVLEEQDAYPTPWRRELDERGVPVFAAPRAGSVDPEVTVRAVLDAIARDGASAVVFWNAITQHKLLLADGLLGVPVFDVSPGEMYFASLDRYFVHPRVGLPYVTPRDYGALLRGVVVKYAAEAERARNTLGARVEVIPNGVVVPELRPQRKAARGPLVVGTLARLSRDKKLAQLILAVRAARDAGAPDFELRIAGGLERGEETHRAELEALAGGLPVRFVGTVDAAAFLAELDVFAMVSEPEGCPNASLEAMAAGLPIAATDAGGVAEQLGDDAGLLVPRGDGHALGLAITRLLRDASLREALGSRAHARARERFSVERMVNDYVRLLVPDLSRSASSP